MSDFVMLDVTLQNFNAAVDEYSRVTRKDAAAVVRHQSRLIIRDLVRRTASDRGNPAMRKTIDTNIRRVFKTPSGVREEVESLIKERTTSFISKGYEAVHKVSWRNEKFGKRIVELFDKQDASGMEALWRRAIGNPMLKMPITDQIDGARLRASRNKQGYVPRGARGHAVIYAGNPSKLNKFIRERQADINIAKAGWVAAANALDAPGIPAAVKKQTKRFGRVEMDLNEAALAPFVLIVNSADPAVAQDASYGIVEKALQGRTNSILADTRHYLERAAKKFNKS